MSRQQHKIELFVFPDGTSVELLVFDHARRRSAASPTPPGPSALAPRPQAPPGPCCVPPPPSREDAGAQSCPVCGSDFVYPLSWDRTSKTTWKLELRCPECETRREVTLGRASVEQFNRALYAGAQAIAREADQMTRRNFKDEVGRIVAALERDLILPMDF